VTDVLDPADVAVITDGLRAYDLNQIGYHDFRPLAQYAAADPCAAKVLRQKKPGDIDEPKFGSPVEPADDLAGLRIADEHGDGRRGRQTTRLHPDRVDDAQY